MGLMPRGSLYKGIFETLYCRRLKKTWFSTLFIFHLNASYRIHYISLTSIFIISNTVIKRVHISRKVHVLVAQKMLSTERKADGLTDTMISLYLLLISVGEHVVTKFTKSIDRVDETPIKRRKNVKLLLKYEMDIFIRWIKKESTNFQKNSRVSLSEHTRTEPCLQADGMLIPIYPPTSSFAGRRIQIYINHWINFLKTLHVVRGNSDLGGNICDRI